jgi:ribose-phosphate pyrophosphokinase
MVTQLRQMKIFTGSAHPDFTQKVADTLGVPMASSKLFRFSDGEIGLSIEESVRGADVYVIQPTSEPVNENLMELLIMIDALRRASAYRINVVTPYFGYARQDRKTKARGTQYIQTRCEPHRKGWGRPACGRGPARRANPGLFRPTCRPFDGDPPSCLIFQGKLSKKPLTSRR